MAMSKRTARRLRRSALVVASALAAHAMLFPSSPARAIVAEQPDDTWQTDGPVYAVARAGSRIYLGGDFRSLTDGRGHTVSRTRLAALDAATGTPIGSWAPRADGIVRAIEASADGSTIFVGGTFDHVNGRDRSNLAAIRASDGSVMHGWKPRTNGGGVNRIEAYGNTVYVGGGFGYVNGEPRPRLAALSAGGGELRSRFNARPDGSVRGLSMAPDGDVLYVGGEFTHIQGAFRENVAAVDPVTGDVRAWSPNPDYPLLDLAATATHVYLAGAGGGGTLAAFEAAPRDDEVWEVRTDGNLQAVSFLGPVVYGGGHFDAVDGERRRKIMAVRAETGTLLAWNPDMNSSVGVRSLVSYGSKLYAGGEFTTVGGRSREGFAQFTDAAR